MTQALPQPGSTPRTRVKRIPEKAVTDRETAYAILDAGVVTIGEGASELFLEAQARRIELAALANVRSIRLIPVR